MNRRALECQMGDTVTSGRVNGRMVKHSIATPLSLHQMMVLFRELKTPVGAGRGENTTFVFRLSVLSETN